MRCCLVLASLLLGSARVGWTQPSRERAVDLRPHQLPFLPRLAMRTTAATSAVAPAATPPVPARDPLVFGQSPPRIRSIDRAEPWSGNVRAQLTLGGAVDGAEPSQSGTTVAGNGLRSEPLNAHLQGH
jgi:hypothetical protein